LKSKNYLTKAAQRMQLLADSLCRSIWMIYK